MLTLLTNKMIRRKNIMLSKMKYWLSTIKKKLKSHQGKHGSR